MKYVCTELSAFQLQTYCYVSCPDNKKDFKYKALPNIIIPNILQTFVYYIILDQFNVKLGLNDELS